MAENTVVRPPGAVVPGGPAKPSVAPGNTRPAAVGGGPYKVGTPEFLSENDVAQNAIYDDEENGYIGVDPQYQNAANATEKPIVAEPEEDPETP